VCNAREPVKSLRPGRFGMMIRFIRPYSGPPWKWRIASDIPKGGGHNPGQMVPRGKDALRPVSALRDSRQADIAVDVGYESETAFNRAFKREYGQPPGQYRSGHKNLPSRRVGELLEATPTFMVEHNSRMTRYSYRAALTANNAISIRRLSDFPERRFGPMSGWPTSKARIAKELVTPQPQPVAIISLRPSRHCAPSSPAPRTCPAIEVQR
jgi:hypothetical protein